MRKYILFFLLCFVTSFSVNAQAPGYLGHKFDFSLNLLISPSFNKMDSSSINLLKAAKLEYTISRHSSIELKLQMFKTNQTFEADENWYSPSVASEYFTEHFDLNVYVISANFTSYIPDWIAPLGRYTHFGISYIYFTSPNFLDESKYSINTQDISSDFNIGINYGIGKKWIVADFISIDFGADFIYDLNWKWLYNGPEFKKQASKRIGSILFANIRGAIGVVF